MGESICNVRLSDAVSGTFRSHACYLPLRPMRIMRIAHAGNESPGATDRAVAQWRLTLSRPLHGIRFKTSFPVAQVLLITDSSSESEPRHDILAYLEPQVAGLGPLYRLRTDIPSGLCCRRSARAICISVGLIGGAISQHAPFAAFTDPLADWNSCRKNRAGETQRSGRSVPFVGLTGSFPSVWTVG